MARTEKEVEDELEFEENVRQEKIKNVVLLQHLQAIFFLVGTGAFIKYLFTGNESFVPTPTNWIEALIYVLFGVIVVTIIWKVVLRIGKDTKIK